MNESTPDGLQESFRPVSELERISSVDTLRGFALLGILVINVVCFAMPMAALFNPMACGDFSGINEFSWRFTYVIFFQKFMAIFSMLFGAGLILMYERYESTGRPFAKVYYRRLLWLWLIGIIHAYFLWYGDILFTYAVCGLLLYPLKKISGKILILLGIIIFLLGIPPLIGIGYVFDYVKTQAVEASEARDAGEELTPLQKSMLENWDEMKQGFNPTNEHVAIEIETHRGDYWEIFIFRALMSIIIQTFGLASMIFWRVSGLMLMGMGLMKLGIFSARRSKKYYLTCAIAGYLIGLPIVIYGSSELIKNNFDAIFKFMIGVHYDYIGGLFIAFAHICAVMYICKLGIWTKIRERLAAVGRMTLTNYLLQTIVMTTIFYGYGFGLFAEFNHATLLLFVVAIWIIQLYYSPIWLRYYRFGPVEWFWRSMTYMHDQPLRRIKNER